ncbi:hypothetical protein FRC01_004359 [Tulasnella sp. 417]|nr:hypothetical protein FRC01_004359 [Tulasnella sp. 417]
MRCFAILPLLLVASALASPFLPLAVSAGTEILRRQTPTAGTCNDQCDAIQTQVDACGKDAACFCTAAIAQGMESCASCKLEADPSSAPTLQTFLNQYVNGCQANGHAVGSLTLTGSVASVLATSTPSVAASSSKPAAATPTTTAGNRNSASVVGVRPISALVAAGMTVAISFL